MTAAITAVAMLSLFAFLVGLGLWQLDRAAQKRARFAEFEARDRAPAIDLADWHGVDADTIRWRRVRATGAFVDRAIILDNRTLGGRAGYEVLTPMNLASGESVLVNRGWLPAPAARETAPRVETPREPVEITGFAGPPPVTGVRFSAAADRFETMTPTLARVQHVDLDDLGRRLDLRFAPYVVYLDPDSPAGFAREWIPPGDGAAKHEAYALQWFTMAAIACVIGAGLARREFRRHD